MQQCGMPAADVWPPCCRGSLSRTPHCGSAVGTSPESRLSQGRGGWWVVAMMQRSDWHLPVTSHKSVLSETRACLHVWTHMYITWSVLWTVNAAGAQSFPFPCRCKARQKAGSSLTHKLTCSRLGSCRFSTRGSWTLNVEMSVLLSTGKQSNSCCNFNTYTTVRLQLLLFCVYSYKKKTAVVTKASKAITLLAYRWRT